MSGLLVMSLHTRETPRSLQHLGIHAVVPTVIRVADLAVRVHRVKTLFLQVVGGDLVEDADAASLVRRVVDDHALARLIHQTHRLLELCATIAAERAEHVPREADRVHPCKDTFAVCHVAPHERNMCAPIALGSVPHNSELPVARGKRGLRNPGDQLLGSPPVCDEVGDRDLHQPVAFGEGVEVFPSHHGPVVVDDLTEHPSRVQPGKPREVDGRLRVAWPLEDPALVVLRSGKMWPGRLKSAGLAGRDRRSRGSSALDPPQRSLSSSPRHGRRRS